MNSIVCRSCNKNIDEDSSFCKHCGSQIVNFHVSIYNEEKLASIFQRVYTTLYNNSILTIKEFEEKFDPFKNLDKKLRKDNDYYQLLVNIIFYSGFKASTVDKYLERISMHFPDYMIVSEYSHAEVENIKNDPQMIQNNAKINACIKNARKFVEIISKYGSINNYIQSFDPNSCEEALHKLKRSLESNFSYIGGITSYHFMTDIGLNVLKPDRVILRIFKRLGFIESEKDLIGAVNIGRAFSKATKLPIRFIDIIFVSYGQLDQIGIKCICSEKNPKCNICGINSECLYVQGKVS